MKNAKEFIQERLDDLALEKHDMFYDDLPLTERDTLRAMALEDWRDYEIPQS